MSCIALHPSGTQAVKLRYWSHSMSFKPSWHSWFSLRGTEARVLSWIFSIWFSRCIQHLLHPSLCPEQVAELNGPYQPSYLALCLLAECYLREARAVREQVEREVRFPTALWLSSCWAMVWEWLVFLTWGHIPCHVGSVSATALTGFS